MKKIVTRAMAIVATALSTAVVLLAVSAPLALAQATHTHTNAAPEHITHAQGELLKIVRQSTERFKNVAVADGEGYKLNFGCVTGPDAGAMGLHYVKMPFVVNPPLTPTGEIDATRPQIVIYEPIPGGGLRLTGADYLILADAWDKDHPGNPPQLMGQLFHYFESPNRFALPAFYTLHVWAWKENPNGAFVNWHPNVSCQSFAPPTP
jgi:hypothetical protein